MKCCPGDEKSLKKAFLSVPGVEEIVTNRETGEVTLHYTKGTLPLDRRRAPEVNWRGVSGMRDKLSHAYFETDLRLVWDVVHQRLPALRDSAARLLKYLEEK